MARSLPVDLLDAAFDELKGLAGPTRANRLEALRVRFPHAADEDLKAALDRGEALKWGACSMAEPFERDWPDENAALRSLATSFPGFSARTYEKALRDGWTLSRK